MLIFFAFLLYMTVCLAASTLFDLCKQVREKDRKKRQRMEKLAKLRTLLKEILDETRKS